MGKKREVGKKKKRKSGKNREMTTQRNRATWVRKEANKRPSQGCKTRKREKPRGKSGTKKKAEIDRWKNPQPDGKNSPLATRNKGQSKAKTGGREKKKNRGCCTKMVVFPRKSIMDEGILSYREGEAWRKEEKSIVERQTENQAIIRPTPVSKTATGGIVKRGVQSKKKEPKPCAQRGPWPIFFTNWPMGRLQLFEARPGGNQKKGKGGAALRRRIRGGVRGSSKARHGGGKTQRRGLRELGPKGKTHQNKKEMVFTKTEKPVAWAFPGGGKELKRGEKKKGWGFN